MTPPPTGSTTDAFAAQIAVPVLVLRADHSVLCANLAAEEWLGTSSLTLQRSGFTAAGVRGVAVLKFLEGVSPEAGDTVALTQSVGGGESANLHALWSEDRTEITLTIAPNPGVGASQVSASAALGFGRMLAHELKNPVASLRGAAQLIAAAADTPDVQELAQLIVEDADRITQLADHWSGVGDLALGELSAVNLNHVVFSALESLKRAGLRETILIEDQFDPSLPLVKGDPILLHQAVLNLLQNACDALVDVPEAALVVETRFDNGPRSRTEFGPAPLHVTVQDNGPGIPDALIADIFAPFVTTKPAGEGLGLAFTSRVAALHNGRVDFESSPGRTQFFLCLPVATEVEP